MFDAVLMMLGALHVELEVVQPLAPKRANRALKAGLLAAFVLQMSPYVPFMLVSLKTFGTEINAVVFDVI